MSRNKDIKLLHEWTGWSYKECRKQMKDNHWNLCQAFNFEGLISKLPDLLEDVSLSWSASAKDRRWKICRKRSTNITSKEDIPHAVIYRDCILSGSRVRMYSHVCVYLPYIVG